ncbi:MAG: hypothetical protein IPG45_37300 [Deltaproteobacteria bacterium]|nr:hypothetical protein [Deltaproteobacteria bacterium]
MKHRALVLLLVIACKSKEPEVAPVAKVAPPPAAAEAKPVAPAPEAAKPEAAKPLNFSEASVLFLETRGTTCVWVEQDPLGEARRELFSAEASCGSLRWAYSPDQKRAAVLVVREEAGPELHTIELATLIAQKQKVPPGKVASIGFAPDQALIALIEEADYEGKMERVKEGGTEFLVFEGKRYEVGIEGAPGLAHAFRQEGEAWKRIETVSTAYETDFAAGIEALAVAKTLGRRGPSYPYELSAFESLAPERPEAKILAAAAPRSEEDGGEWGTVQTGTITLYAWAETTEFVLPKAELYRLKGDTLRPFVLPLEKSSYVELQARGPYLLLTGGEEQAWLFKVPNDQPIARWKGVYGMTFRSPRPAR